MSADNRLTANQLAGLVPGDEVTIEAAADSGRPWRATGFVVHVVDPYIVVSIKGPKSDTYQEWYTRRDGIRIGSPIRAELIDPDRPVPSLSEAHRRIQRIEALYWE